MPPGLSRFTSRTKDGWLLEHAVGSNVGEAPSLDGVVVGAGQSGPLRLTYTVECHPSLSVRRATIHIQYRNDASDRVLTADGFGHWFDHGVPVTALTGSLDLVLWCTPSTLALPLRRLDLPFGAHHECPVAALAGPDAPLSIWHFRFAHRSGDRTGHLYDVVNLTRDESVLLRVDHQGWVLGAGDFRRA